MIYQSLPGCFIVPYADDTQLLLSGTINFISELIEGTEKALLISMHCIIPSFGESLIDCNIILSENWPILERKEDGVYLLVHENVFLSYKILL